MLVLSRRIGEQVVVDRKIEITVVEINGKMLRTWKELVQERSN